MIENPPAALVIRPYVRRFNTPEKILVAFLGAVACGSVLLVCTLILVLVLSSTVFERVVSISLDRDLEISLMGGGLGFLAGAAMVLIRLWEDEERAPRQRLTP